MGSGRCRGKETRPRRQQGRAGGREAATGLGRVLASMRGCWRARARARAREEAALEDRGQGQGRGTTAVSPAALSEALTGEKT